MDWMNALNDIVGKYSGQGGAPATQPDAHNDYQRVAQAAPPEVVAGGLSQAFLSDQTPPFPQMLGNLFGNSDPNQKAGLLNKILGSIGPGALGSLPGLGSLAGMLGGGGQVTPEQASQISPDQVQQIASHAQQQNPSIVDQASSFYAKHPQVVQAAGGLALSIALQHMLRRS